MNRSNQPPTTNGWDWQMLGRCRTRSAGWFFHPDHDRGRISRRLREASAKLICADCRVRPECAAQALETREPFGVWGGLTAVERATLSQLGWRDAADSSGRLDVARLERRLRAAQAAQEEHLSDPHEVR
jgi:WhiB family transcriptional regulator, redox-sensing transcriptional regulator